MLGRDSGRIADPLASCGQVILSHQLRFPARPKVLEQPWPRLQSGLFDDSLKLLPKVQAAQPVLRDDVLRSILGLLESIAQVGKQLREDRHDPRRLPLVVFSLAAMDS